MDPNPTPPATSSATGTLTAIGEVMKNKYVAAVVSLLIAVSVTIQTMALTKAASFPSWLIVTCGIVLGVGTILGLYSPGARGPTTTTLLVMLAIAATLLTSSPAAAQTLHVGPSVPLVAVTPGDPHPLALAPGAGVTLGCDLFPSTLLGRPVNILTLGGDVFGAALSNGATVAANVSIAIHAALYELFTIGVGLKLYDSSGYGAIGGTLSGRSVFLLVGLDYGLINTLAIGHAGTPPPDPEPPAMVPVPVGGKT